MSLCKVFLFAALVATCLVVWTDAMMDVEDITPEKAEVFFICINTIVCDLRLPKEIKRMASKPGPELYKEGMRWLSECYGLDLTDMQEFWGTYSDKVCNQSLDKRRECTKEMMLNYANFYEEYCEENLKPAECTKGEETITEVMMIIEEYTASGDCNSPEEAMEEVAEEMEGKAVSNAEEAAEDFEGMAGKFPKPPGFG